MIVIPVSRRPDWRNPPIVTLLLILVNILVFFGLQHGDDARVRKAYDHYANSILIETELPRYVRHLEDAGDAGRAAVAGEALSRKQWYPVLRMMENDDAFMKQLRDGKITRPGDENHSAWRRQRDEFERLLHKTIIGRFA
ncbi:MAG: hypothetical protein LBI87_13415, partial [Candidatus Accumulibacter sp.]|nr:hypothetical protein [Accumulibacter sp.]